ncbi:MAG: DNA polymerase III subunit delta [Elusimicrobia bacterium]|nr:DNA polymerase III subunit delta [Elusimicrobiota bacterium]
MGIIDSGQFVQSLKGLKEFPPFILLVGDEESAIEESLRNVKILFKEIYGQSMPEFNMETFHGEKDEAETVLDACLTLPLLSRKKLVVIQHYEKSPQRTKEKVEHYCQSENPSTTLVLVCQSRISQPFLQTHWVQQVSKKGLVVKFWRLFDSKRPQWIAEECAKHRKKISSSAALLLSEIAGETQGEMRSEIEKLVLFVSGKNQIEREDVKQSILSKRNQTIWDFVEQIEKGDPKSAGIILQGCLDQGEEPLAMLHLLARSLRKNAGSLGNQKTESLLRECKNADRLLKSGDGTESAVLERLLYLYSLKPLAERAERL